MLTIKMNDNIEVIFTRPSTIKEVRRYADATRNIISDDPFDTDRNLWAQTAPYSELLTDAVRNMF